MFIKKKSSKQNESFIEVKNLPILVLDSDWLKVFSKDKQTPEMEETEKELRELLKEQGRLNDQIKKLSSNKKSILSKMLEQSNEVRENATEKAKDELASSRSNVEKINYTLTEIEARAELLPEKIESVNNRLFQLGVKAAYNIMSKNLKEVKKYEDNIDKLRTRLAEEINKKEKLEDTFKSSRDFLLEYIGKEGISQLDDKYKGSI